MVFRKKWKHNHLGNTDKPYIRKPLPIYDRTLCGDSAFMPTGLLFTAFAFCVSSRLPRQVDSLPCQRITDLCAHRTSYMVAGQPLSAIHRFGSVLHRRTVKLSTPRGPCSLPSYSGNASSRLHRNTSYTWALRPPALPDWSEEWRFPNPLRRTRRRGLFPVPVYHFRAIKTFTAEKAAFSSKNF